MSLTLSVEYEQQTFIWDGRMWFNARDHTIPHQALIHVLDRLIAPEAKRGLEGDLAVEKLQNQVAKLHHARASEDSDLIREGIIGLYEIVDDLREEHTSKPFTELTVASIRVEQDRAGLKFPAGGREHLSICWDCHKRGVTTKVDKRIDPECQVCHWVICPKCGACQDPKRGDCPENHQRAGRN